MSELCDPKRLVDCRIIVFISNKFLWEIEPFFHYFNRHWGEFQPVTVVGAHLPPASPPNMEFIPVSSGLLVDDDFYFGRFSNGVRWYLQSITESFVIILCADFWLNRRPAVRLIGLVRRYMAERENVLRFQLGNSGAHLYAREPVERYHGVSVYGCPADHPHCFLEMSLTPAIWNRAHLLSIVQDGWSPWEFETAGQRVLEQGHGELRSRTTCRPLMQVEHLMREGGTIMDVRSLPPERQEEFARWAPAGCRVVRT